MAEAGVRSLEVKDEGQCDSVCVCVCKMPEDLYAGSSQPRREREINSHYNAV